MRAGALPVATTTRSALAFGAPEPLSAIASGWPGWSTA